MSLRRARLCLLVVALLAGVSGCAGNAADEAVDAPETATTSVAAPVVTTESAAALRIQCERRYLDKFTLRQRLAQLLTVGVKNVGDAMNVVRTEQVGGLFIGSWTDRALLTGNQLSQVNAAAIVAPMVSIDEEGGRVARLATRIGAMPAARTMAHTMSPEQVYQLFLDRGRKLRQLGVTVDFAPDIDVNAGPANTVIGDRSFSGDPAVVATYGEAVVRGLRQAGVSAVIKHFPGHGRGSGDSHKGPVTTPPLAELERTDLLPFARLVGSGAAVMVGHLDVPGLTNGVPASINPAAMALLRNGRGYGAAPFDGVIFTDDLGGMAAITSRMGIPEAVERALVAGADVALWISTGAVPQVLDRLQQAVGAGRLNPARVNDSVLRIARYKDALSCP